MNVGSIQVLESRNGSMTTTIIDTNSAVPMYYYMAVADFFALIVATILAAPLAREIDGHLEVTFTKPISRLRYALGAVGADIAGILAASLMTVLAFYLCQLLFETPRLDFGGISSRRRHGSCGPTGLVCDALRGDDVGLAVVRGVVGLRVARRPLHRFADASFRTQQHRHDSLFTTSRGCFRDSIR